MRKNKNVHEIFDINSQNLIIKSLKISKAIKNCVNVQKIYEIWTKFEEIQIITCPL